LRVTPARLITARMREDDKDDGIGNPFLLLFQGQDCLNRTPNMFFVEYKLGIFQGGSVICPMSSLTISQVWLFCFLAAVSMFLLTFVVRPLPPDQHRATPDNHEWHNLRVYQVSDRGRNRACKVNLSVPLLLVGSF